MPKRPKRHRSRFPNLGNLLVGLGLAGLAASFFVPELTARRVARVETRAFDAARALLDAARALEPFEFDDPDALAQLDARFRARCEELGLPSSYMPDPAAALADAAWPAARFESKHHMFMVTRSPPPSYPPADQDPEAHRPLEVYAWPRTLLSPGHSAFFLSEDGLPAFSRNLSADYSGWENPPRPGAGRPRDDLDGGWVADYRGHDDERWLMVP